MKVKCYAIYQNGNEEISEYANPSQKNFLSFELTNAVRKFKKTERIELEHTSNGVWYCKHSERSRHAIIQQIAPTWPYCPHNQHLFPLPHHCSARALSSIWPSSARRR